jgi:hypothetical protein
MLPLADVSELETHLGRTLDPDQAEQALVLASGAVRAYCGWDLARESTTMYTEGPFPSSSLITLPTLELLDVVEIRGGDGTVIDPADYPYSFARKGQVWGYWVPRQQYELDVLHGYDPVPDVLKLVTLDLSARSLANPEQLISATVGQVSRTWGGGTTGTGGTSMTALHENLLDRYRLFNP